MIFRKKERTLLDDEIDRALRDLNHHAVSTEDYERTLKRVVVLHEMKMAEKPRTRVSKDVMFTVAGNLLGILMIIRHEFANPINSKAIQLLIKPRI